MHLRRLLAAGFVLLMAAGCTGAATRTGPMPQLPYSPDDIGDYSRDRGGDGGGGAGM